MSIELREYDKPKLKRIKMTCDDPLDSKLNNFEFTKFFNKNTCNLILGSQGSGKTAFITSAFKSKEFLCEVYDKIYLFCPEASLDDIDEKQNIWINGIPQKRKFNELTSTNLQYVKEKIGNEPKGEHSCIILDDMTAQLQDREKPTPEDKHIVQLLYEIIYNHRHLGGGLSVFMIVQSFMAVPKRVRKLFTNIIVFNVDNETYEDIFKLYTNIKDKHVIHAILDVVYNAPHNFLFINRVSRRIFKNMDEIIIK